ncbi:hypothetical protein [Falsiroseomonas sp. E2-1-a20]|uniref:hypothetical protein n=1 Tax=Falsiroseomonas sp. E2-1-a20 TaxID=3239300 RepID=UPI003F2B0630
MCGLMGLFHPLDPATQDFAPLLRAAGLRRHRELSSETRSANPHVGLNYRCIAIFDLASGAQPMAEDSRMIIYFNKDTFWLAYNYSEPLRALQSILCGLSTRILKVFLSVCYVSDSKRVISCSAPLTRAKIALA